MQGFQSIDDIRVPDSKVDHISKSKKEVSVQKQFLKVY